jgi:hypothetical protein
MTTQRLWVLGASDPEMEAIEKLLRECGEALTYASTGGQSVRASQAYSADRVEGATHWVECEAPGQDREVVIDHHRDGDPGYGRPPSDFLRASSIGQVFVALHTPTHCPAAPVYHSTGVQRVVAGTEVEDPEQHHCEQCGTHAPTRAQYATYVASQWELVGEEYTGFGDELIPFVVPVPLTIVLCAAADHCLGAAYRGECLGVDPDALMAWRAETRAAHQGRSVEEVLADVGRATMELEAAPWIVLHAHRCDWHAEGALGSNQGGDCANERGTDWADDPCHEVVVRDMRRATPVRELPEAATRAGVGYLSGPLIGPDGRQKITCSGDATQIAAFLRVWAPAQGLTGIYGDPARGFAGGYLP